MAFVKDPKLFLGDGVYICEDKSMYFLRCGIWLPLFTGTKKIEYIDGYLTRFYPESEILQKYRESFFINQ